MGMIAAPQMGLLGAALDPHMLDLLCRALLDHLGPNLLQGGGVLCRSKSLVGASKGWSSICQPTMMEKVMRRVRMMRMVNIMDKMDITL